MINKLTIKYIKSLLKMGGYSTYLGNRLYKSKQKDKYIIVINLEGIKHHYLVLEYLKKFNINYYRLNNITLDLYYELFYGENE